MNTSQRVAKVTRLMKIGAVLTTLGMLIVLSAFCGMFISKHDPMWILLILFFIAGAICAVSLMNAFVVPRFSKAAMPSSSEMPPR